MADTPKKRGRPGKPKVAPQDIDEVKPIKKGPAKTSNEKPAPVAAQPPMEQKTPEPVNNQSVASNQEPGQTPVTPTVEPNATVPASKNNDWDPLTSEPVINRGYGTTQTAPSQTGGAPGQPFAPIADIPEPRFNIPNSETILNEPDKPPVMAPAPPPPAVNPQMEQLPTEDKRKAAETAVELIFYAWQKLNDFARKKAKIDMKEMQTLHDSAKVDLDMVVPRDSGPRITFRDIVNDYNNQTDELFIVDEKFKKEVREPMIREFMKRNIGLTDIQKIMAYGGMEVIGKVGQFIEVKKTSRELINTIIGAKAYWDERHAPKPSVQPSAPPPQPSSASQTESSRQETTSQAEASKEQEFREPEEKNK